ncbi:MAG: HupE/UreJ family protein [Rhizobiaceae bacterium]
MRKGPNPNRRTTERFEAVWRIAVFTALIFIPDIARAHTGSLGEGVSAGFSQGFIHPLLGPDHVIAMVAVGLWGAILGLPSIWVLPIAFPLVMAMGGAVAVIGFPLAHVETGIALSGIILGLCVALALRLPAGIAAIMVGAFAVFHGYAHGIELPTAANPIAYSAGFVIATGLLHLIGIVLGLLSRHPMGLVLVRMAGAGIALGGAWYLAA